MSFVTRPFADSKAFGLEKAALAEMPLSGVHWPKFALNKLAYKHGSLLVAYAYLDFPRAEEIDMGFANRAPFCTEVLGQKSVFRKGLCQIFGTKQWMNL